VELVSHYGKEHFCPISLFHVYGNSEYEVLDNEEDSRTGSISHRQEEDSTEEEMLFDLQKNNSNTDVVVEGRNLFGSAKDAVINIVKKAAEVLTKSPAPQSVMVTVNETDNKETIHPTVCYTAVEPVNVSRAINGSLSCEWKELKFLASLPWLHSSLLLQCQKESFDQTFSSIELAFAESIWTRSTIQALCHWILPEDPHIPASLESVSPSIVELDVPENVNPCTEAQQVGEVESIATEQPSVEQTELENLEQLFSEEMGTVATSSDDLPIGMETIIPNDGFLIEPSKPIASHNAARPQRSPPQQQQQEQHQQYDQQQPQEQQIQQQQHRQQQTQKESVFVRLSNR
jgi:hypothetical protein